MVHLPHQGKLRRDVKEEALDDGDAAARAEASPFHKRSRLALQHWSTDGGSVSNQQSSQHGFLDEPSPLGLRLKKSPSLVDLIQMKLVQAGKAKDVQHSGTASASEKLKASNFSGSVLRIGSWEWVSRYEGDLVAKCYFAKHKLVWEVLDGGLKSKIEIQWSDICAMKVVSPENEPGILEIALSRQPLFFRETNPQPRKHTLWQATSDFTGGQASIHRRHFLQCPPGMMNKHVEKLVHCDPRLYSLSQQNDINLDNPYFESKSSIFEDAEGIKGQDFEHKDDGDQLAPQRFTELLPPHSASGRIDTEARQLSGTPDKLLQHFPCSVSGTQVIKQDAASGDCERQESIYNWNGIKVPGIRRSITQIIGDGDGDGSMGKLTFDELTRQLLNDSQITNAADERMLMSRVNSLCSLIQRDSGSGQTNPSSSIHGDNEMQERKPQPYALPVSADSGSNTSLPPRQESFGDLLTHLPRISSFPHFL
uniref:TRF2/HOY1 PH-like domain-containing protein n=1 Tax=Oryza nivara TaxID=4536 RepID=A0A0E0HN64_ORYNI